jgi:hypothetical protein
MLMMGELQLFLGLQIKQTKEGTFVHQAKYTKDILKKFKMDDLKPQSTPMRMTTTLNADGDGDSKDQKEYWSMIGTLLYLMATRPDIQFFVCLCARFQASPRTSLRQAVKLLSSVFGTRRPVSSGIFRPSLVSGTKDQAQKCIEDT